MMAAPTLLDTAPIPPPIYRYGNNDILPAWSQREAAAAEQPWTATRCHRQLRPLLTHLMALRKEKARAALKQRNYFLRQNASPNKRSTADDGLASRKRVRYTYSLKGTGRRRQGRPDAMTESAPSLEKDEKTSRVKVAPLKQQGTHSFCPGEVVVATPVLSRARKHRQAWSLPSSPIMHCTSTTTTDAGLGPSFPTTDDAETARPRHKNPAFKYRGYYQTSRLGANSSASPSIDGDWAAVAKATPPEFHHLYESIFRAVDALLRATTCTRQPARKSNSLLAMCLRKVPQYVAICEETEREEAEKEGIMQLPSSSVSLGIYSDLESLGSENSGWKHLRVVVREHGIGILKSACTEGLLHDTFIRLLVRLCTHLKAYDEAESLIGALFDSHASSLPKGGQIYQKPDGTHINLSVSTGPPALLGLLLQYADETGRTSVPLRQITDLLNNGRLPAAWLSTQAFGSLWHRVIRLLSSRGSPVCEENILLDFVATAIVQLIQSRPDDDILDSHLKAGHENASNSGNTNTTSLTSSSSYHTIVSILGSICAVGILQQEASLESGLGLLAPEPAVVSRLAATVQSSLSEISRKIKFRKGQHKHNVATHCYPRQYLLMLSLCLLQHRPATNTESWMETNAEICESNPFDEAALRQFIESATSYQRGQLYDATIAFVTCVAENCGRGSESASSSVPAARAYLLGLSTHAAGYLSSASSSNSENGLAGRLKAGAAFLLASRSNDLRDLAFAESLGKSSVQKDRHRAPPRHSPASASMGALSPPSSKTWASPTAALFDGYRWEEGISEWVISNPSVPSSRSVPKPRPARKSELVVVIDSMAPSELTGQNSQKPLRRSASRSGRLSLPTSSPTSYPSPGNRSDIKACSIYDQDSDNDTPSSPRTPGSRSDAAPCPHPKRLRRLEVAPSTWHTRPRRWTTRSLLNFVSDNEDDDEDQGDESDETLERIHAKDETARMPLFDLASNVKNARRPSESVGNTLKGKAAAALSGSYQLTDDDADVTSSDDELCL